MVAMSFPDLPKLAQYLREALKLKQFVLLYAHNSTGKTRLSVAFKDLGKRDGESDTLYFNAFTEDLFSWDNDLDHDRERVLKLNTRSRFFAGIRALLGRYADFDFRIDVAAGEVSFSREILDGDARLRLDDIKVSRGEENIFIWCFFLAIVELAMDPEIEAYGWVHYIYIDDPISSLDENNAIAVANHLAQALTQTTEGPRVVVSTHHVLFFNVLCNELKKKAHRHFLKRGTAPGSYALQDTSAKPFLHHLATLTELHQAQASGALYTHHFNMMRRAMEQTANFFGMDDWKDCIQAADDDPDKALYKRMIDLMSHGDYSLYEPREMMEENKAHFRTIFRRFVSGHPFNPTLFPLPKALDA
jgi:AAA domain